MVNTYLFIYAGRLPMECASRSTIQWPTASIGEAGEIRRRALYSDGSQSDFASDWRLVYCRISMVRYCVAHFAVAQSRRVLLTITVDYCIVSFKQRCVEAIKESPGHAHLADDLEINKAVLYLRQRDVPQATEALRSFERRSNKMAPNAAVNLSTIYFLVEWKFLIIFLSFLYIFRLNENNSFVLLIIDLARRRQWCWKVCRDSPRFWPIQRGSFRLPGQHLLTPERFQ